MKLTDFMEISHLQSILNTFSEATGLATVAIDADGNYITKESGFTDFCVKHTRSCEEGAKRCQNCDGEGKSVFECHAGLMNFSVDIILNGEKLGAVIGGQVFSREPNEAKITRLAEEFGLDPDAYIRAAQKVPVRSEKSIRSAGTLLNDIINNVVLQEYMNATEYKKIHVWEDEIVNATDAVSRIKENTRELEALASKQTIMALNASIETARVGAAGAGFGVIAKQMGVFSKQSTEIYKKIIEDANNISEAIGKMNNT